MEKITPSKKLTRKEIDDRFAAHMPGVLSYHQTMLADSLRNKLLFKAIKQSVKPGMSFLDIGAGSGVWAVLAAKLGATRVVAIEIEECLIPVIYKHAQENGVADRIEIIHANSNDVKLKGKFDVIVSELFGGDALGAETVRSFVNLRTRFLAPGGVLIPQKLEMFAAPAHVKGSVHEVPAGLPFTTNFLRSLKLNYSLHLTLAERDRVQFLAEPKPLISLDFHRDIDAPSLDNMTASWHVKNLKKANGIVTFNRSTFTDAITMDAFGSKSWGVGVNEFIPFAGKSGEIAFRLTLDQKQSNWSITLPSDPAQPPQNYGPVFAFARMRMAQKMTPHRRVKPKKSESSDGSHNSGQHK